jgi:intraflagellar transport protein 122
LAVSWANDGQHFALGLFDGSISIRDKLGDERTLIKVGISPVWSLSWTVLQDTDVLTTSNWDKKISFFNLDGKQVGRDREVDFNACTLRHTPTGEFFLMGGSDRKLSLWTAEGVKLNSICEAKGWVWSSQMRSKQNQIAVGTHDGTISIYQINFHTIHGLYQDKYAFRQNMTEVMIQDLSTDQRARLKCRDYVQKIAIYKENLAIQLSDRIIIYEMALNGYGEMQYRIKEKIQQIFECNLLVVTCQSLIVCHDNQIRMYSFTGKLEREWSFDVFIRYIKVIGGPAGKEGVLIGLKSGSVFQIFVNNPFPIQLLEQKNPIRCLDLSLARTKLAIVDDQNTCLVYDMQTKELLYSEPNANSVSWNSMFDDMLCFSGNGLINIKIANFPVFSQNSNGFVVGFEGSRVNCLNKYSMNSLDISFSSSIESFLERRDFDSAYRVACLGATQSDWRKIGMCALEDSKFLVAKKAFIRIKEVKYFDIIRQMEKSKDKSEYELLWGEVNAFAGRYYEVNLIQIKSKAAKIFKKCGQIQKAIDMFTDMNMWDAATSFAQANPSKSIEILRKKAQLQMDKNELEAAANTYIEIEDYLSAIKILGENSWYDKLIALSRNLTKAHYNEIKSCVEWFQKAGKPEYVIETLRKMGDIPQLIQYHIQLKQWDDAFTLIEMHPEFGVKLYLPYADWLAAQSRYNEAQEFYHKAGEWDAAIRVLKELSSASVVEKRFDDASKYFWALASEISIKCSKEAKKTASYHLDISKYHQWSQLYYAYHFVYSYVEEPFSSQLSSTLFFMARYIYHYCLKNASPPGISVCHLLFALGRLGKILGGYKVAQFCFEKLLNLSYPIEWEHIVETSMLTLLGKPKTDSNEVCRRCFACGSPNPPLNPVSGDECTICHESFIHSFYSLDDLPLVRFTFAKNLDANVALSLLKAEPPVGSKSLDTLVSSIQSKKLSGAPLELDEATLASLDPHQIFFASDQGGILCTDSLLKVATCSKCKQFFMDEEWQFCSSCPFCKS